MFHSPAFAKALVISTISYLHIFTFAYSSSVALAKEDCAAYAAQVLDGSGIRIEFDSEERGFDCLSIKNKLGGKDVQFGDGATDGSRAGLWAMKFWKDGMENLDCFLYGELVGELIPVGEVPMVDVKWEYKDVGEFKVPAIMSAVWLNDKGERRAFIANISGEERRFEFKFTPNGVTHSVTLPPRSVMDCEEL